MRSGFALAAAATILAATAASMTSAQADEWCGYGAKDHSVIECGYTSNVECENATGKGGMCFIDPDYALNVRQRATTLRAAAGRG
jgi:hypothetical protein